MKISEDPEQFLSRMRAMLRNESDLDVKSKMSFQGDHDHLAVGFSPHSHQIDQLVGMFIYWPEKYPLLNIQAMARWEPTFPSYEVYVGAIKDLFVERIQAYNRRYKRRYRLRIPSIEACLPKLTPKLKEKFDAFTMLANKNRLHTYDWKRFYEFVVASYRSQRDLNQSELRYHLRAAGFEEEMVDYLADAFHRCKDFYIETDWKRRNAYYTQ